MRLACVIARFEANIPPIALALIRSGLLNVDDDFQRFPGADGARYRRVCHRGCTASLLAEAFDQIRENAEGNVAVLTHLLQSLEIIAGQNTTTRRRQALSKQAELMTTTARRSIVLAHDRAEIEACLARVSRIFEDPSP